MKNPEQTAIKQAELAIKYAKGFNVELKFSEQDISKIESILDYYHQDLNPVFFKKIIRKFKNEEPTEAQIWSMATIWGSYIGELIRKFCNNDYKWVIEEALNYEPMLHLKKDDNNRIFPVDKSYKRLKNGKEDSIQSFYDIIKMGII
ncbi:hypothetical protein NUH30_19030 [Leptospira sp. 85282-16]|uniref:hypothetical protein n=1 Tax=Leptospira sp. 85282-16 TaxID=2971256 RepID=UPI0021BE077F|nr:hypothetical protein [Leptospira sp. 85282-16]MCT8335788.1 hypothetical protein [Leptospira sp. 85282-16]